MNIVLVQILQGGHSQGNQGIKGIVMENKFDGKVREKSRKMKLFCKC